MLKGSPLKRT
jgi:hypothetical protein